MYLMQFDFGLLNSIDALRFSGNSLGAFTQQAKKTINANTNFGGNHLPLVKNVLHMLYFTTEIE